MKSSPLKLSFKQTSIIYFDLRIPDIPTTRVKNFAIHDCLLPNGTLSHCSYLNSNLGTTNVKEIT